MRLETKISKQICNDTDNVVKFVFEYLKLDNNNVLSRKKDITNARRLIIGILKERYEEKISHKFMAKKIGYKYAQDSVNAYKRFKELKKFDKDFNMTYQIISSLCQEK